MKRYCYFVIGNKGGATYHRMYYSVTKMLFDIKDMFEEFNGELTIKRKLHKY